MHYLNLFTEYETYSITWTSANLHYFVKGEIGPITHVMSTSYIKQYVYCVH